MVPLREFGFSKPIILGLSHARSIQFLKCKDSGNKYVFLQNKIKTRQIAGFV
jgi:hypothetical protein